MSSMPDGFPLGEYSSMNRDWGSFASSAEMGLLKLCLAGLLESKKLLKFYKFWSALDPDYCMFSGRKVGGCAWAESTNRLTCFNCHGITELYMHKQISWVKMSCKRCFHTNTDLIVNFHWLYFFILSWQSVAKLLSILWFWANMEWNTDIITKWPKGCSVFDPISFLLLPHLWFNAHRQ